MFGEMTGGATGLIVSCGHLMRERQRIHTLTCSVLAALATAVLVPACARPVRTPGPFSVVHTTETLVPWPVSVERTDGPPFSVTPATRLVVTGGDADARRVAEWLSAFMAMPGRAFPAARHPV